VSEEQHHAAEESVHLPRRDADGEDATAELMSLTRSGEAVPAEIRDVSFAVALRGLTARRSTATSSRSTA
jgi:hypothetical protein